MMQQTTLDQFYKITRNKKNFKNIKIVKESSNVRSPVIIKQKKRSLENTKTSAFLYKNSRENSYKTSGKPQMARSNTSCSNETSYLKMTNVKSTPIKAMETKAVTLSSSIYTSPVRSQQCTQSHNGSKFIPKSSSPIKNALEKSMKLTRRKLFKDRTEELISKMIDNLNLAKERAIANNDIDLEKVYSSRRFNYNYNKIDTTTSMKYEISDVIVPVDTYSLHFFLVVVTVFSNPINFGYFDEHELDLIFSLLTLSKDAQALFIRMLKRKYTWHRINSIKYPEISDDLKSIFDELISQSIFKNNTDEEEMSVLLNLLQVDEIRKLCQDLKISNAGKKNGVQSILNFCKKTKSLFPGMLSPTVKLRTSIKKLLGNCVLLNNIVKEVVDRIITLLIPNRDPTETIADVFLTILRAETNQKFPQGVISDFPIFASKKHLLDYIEAKSVLSDILNAIEKKQWKTVRNLGFLAAQRLPLYLEIETQNLKDSTLPRHIRHFLPGYVWLKILSKSVDAFKKTRETMSQAVEFLQTLINQNCHMRSKKGQWYNELIKIEMHHRKNLDVSVTLLSNAILCDSLTEVDRLDLLDRTKMLYKRKSGISQHTKDTVKQILNSMLNEVQLKSQPSSITIQGTLCQNIMRGKSTWRISNCMEEEVYGTVEDLALHHYKCKGYPKGVHCEGALPMMLFGTLFWDEIYNVDIPGARVSLYQDAPMDLFSSEFYENRKEQLDMKLQKIREFKTIETMSKYLKHKFDLHCEYKSVLVSLGSVFDSDNLQEIAFCLGVGGIIGICERLIHNFSLWTAGFPDLIVWNAQTKKYKIVEVKGPGDSLSTKQKLWLKYLNQLDLNTEVCYCEVINPLYDNSIVIYYESSESHFKTSVLPSQ